MIVCVITGIILAVSAVLGYYISNIFDDIYKENPDD